MFKKPRRVPESSGAAATKKKHQSKRTDVIKPRQRSLRLWPGLHGGADHPPGQRGTRPPRRRRPAGGREPERGGGLGDPGADEPAELPLGAPEGGEHGEAEQVGKAEFNSPKM